MHIPDGFLSTPVWLSLDVMALPAVGYFARKAQAETDESRAPLLGVMGAFVFAAQMINFPVGIGTSGHLVGGALLAFTVGPASAVVVMTAILALQALIFQDGGLLALGANTINMAVVGVLVGYLPYRHWRGGGLHRLAVFSGGFLSVLVAACLAVSELLISGIPMPGPVLGASLGLFVVAALIEGTITLAILEALNRMNPAWVREPTGRGRPALGALSMAAMLLVTVGVLFASVLPDGLEKLAEQVGISEHARNLIKTPLGDYEASFLEGEWLRQAAAGVAGLLGTAILCLLIARLIARGKGA